MSLKFFLVILVVFSGLGYHLCQKLTSTSLNPFVALIVTYLFASIISIIAYFIFIPNTNLGTLVTSVKGANISSILLGVTVVGLELGYLLVYRMGWNISFASLLANTSVALLLIPIGLIVFKEKISITTLTGVVLCVVGLILISKK